jgi:hypothetical protein
MEMDRREGWHEPAPEVMPRPTYWPAVTALGVVFLFWGVVTTFIVSAVGLALLVLALGGWIAELRNEQHRSQRG